MDDQEVAARARCATSWLTLPGGVDKFRCRLAGYASEFDLQISIGKQRVYPLAMLFPQSFVARQLGAGAAVAVVEPRITGARGN